VSDGGAELEREHIAEMLKAHEDDEIAHEDCDMEIGDLNARIAHLEREREADRAAIRALRTDLEEIQRKLVQAEHLAINANRERLKEQAALRDVEPMYLGRMLFVEWKRKHAAAIARATGQEGAR
jgi:chromosome segregation ATPase